MNDQTYVRLKHMLDASEIKAWKAVFCIGRSMRMGSPEGLFGLDPDCYLLIGQIRVLFL
jgi:hypothetical protein